jgi:hypothetical protein
MLNLAMCAMLGQHSPLSVSNSFEQDSNKQTPGKNRVNIGEPVDSRSDITLNRTDTTLDLSRSRERYFLGVETLLFYAVV